MITPLNTEQPKPYVNAINLQNAFLKNGVLAKINLGSPSKNCLGVGICKIDLLSSIKPKSISLSPCSAIAMIKKHSDDRLAFFFRKDSLSSRTIEAHFHDHTFIMEEDFVVPIFLVKRFACQSVLHRGFYQVEESSEFLKICF